MRVVDRGRHAGRPSDATILESIQVGVEVYDGNRNVYDGTVP